MEYAKDEVFSIRYNAKKDKLEYGIGTRIIHKIQQNKVLTLLVAMGVFVGTLNFVFIYYFFFLLNTINK